MRHVIVHYHIFKNAGSTIDSILTHNFGDRFGNVEGPNPWDTLKPGEVLKHAEGNPSLAAITSHHARLPLPESPEFAFHPIIFLRDPIDRVGSVYEFERRQPIDSPSLGVKIAHQNDLAGYVRWRLSVGPGAVLKNFQTVHLAARETDMRVAVATKDDLESARERLAELPFFGLVEHFAESVARMAAFLSQAWGTLDLRYSVANRSTDRRSEIEDRVSRIRVMLGSELYRELLESNALDLQLYNYALKLFSSSLTA